MNAPLFLHGNWRPAPQARPEYASNNLRLTHDRFGNPYGSKPYRPSAARRQHIHGAIEPMDTPKGNAWSILSTAVWVVCGLYAASLWIA